VPGELLVTTGLNQDVEHMGYWQPPAVFEYVPLGHGDLLLVLGSWEERYEVNVIEPNNPSTYDKKSVTLALHMRTNRCICFTDIKNVAWLWRPDTMAYELRRIKEIRKRGGR
jgi:hypothetical protein